MPNLLQLLKSGRLNQKEPTTEKVIILAANQAKFICNNHFGPNGKKMPVGIVFSNQNDLEYNCECGLIYRREIIK
jgi:hypothetical protein